MTFAFKIHLRLSLFRLYKLNYLLDIFSGPECGLFEVSTTLKRPEFKVRWTCVESDSDPAFEFQVNYTLVNKDQCNAADDLLDTEQSTDWGQLDRETEPSSNYTHYFSKISGLILYSTYVFDIYSRDSEGNVQRLYGNQIQTESAGENNYSMVI